MNDRFEKICVMVEEEQKVLSMIVGGLASRIASIENQAPQANPSDVTTRTVIGLVIPANLSITNIRELIKTRGALVRDCLPIARGVIETLVNASFLMTDTSLADQAWRHSQQKLLRKFDKKFGRGEFSIHVKYDAPDELKGISGIESAIQEFSTRKGQERAWTELSVEQRIEAIGHRFGKEIAGGFLGAYAVIYSDASEVLHGSLYGAQLFYRSADRLTGQIEDHKEACRGYAESIVFSLFLGLNSLIRALCQKEVLSDIDALLGNYYQKFVDLHMEELESRSGDNLS